MLGEPHNPRDGGAGDWTPSGWGGREEGKALLGYNDRCPQWGCFVSCLVPQGVSNTGSLPQHHPLPGVSDIPDDGAAGPGEAGRLASHLHHLHPQWHHRQPGQCHLPALQGRGEGLGALSQILSAARDHPPSWAEVWGRGWSRDSHPLAGLLQGEGEGVSLPHVWCHVCHMSPRVRERAGSPGRQMANLMPAKTCQP